MVNEEKILLNLTRDEFVLLLNSMQLYRIAIMYLNYSNKIDESNCFTDVLFYNMTTKAEDEIDVYFTYSKESILIALNSITLYKKVLSSLNEREYMQTANSLILKLKNINK